MVSANEVEDKKKLLLLDGHSLAFRAFYALPADKFTDSSGQHTNAVYGFISMLTTLLEQEKPSHVAAAFDLAGPTFRSEKFADYKAQRPETPPEFKGQIELIRQALKTFGITTVDYKRYEADDVIATLATQGHKQGFDTYICTGDRDSLQLVTDDVTVLYTLRGVSNLARFTPEAVEEKYGVTPTQYPDLAALRGDTSDNMPGVPGVGPKTAQKWINKYGSLNNLIDNIDDIGGKVGDALRRDIDTVIQARELTEMVRDLPINCSPEDCEIRPPARNDVNDFFDDIQFGTNLRERVFSVIPTQGGSVEDDNRHERVSYERVGLQKGEIRHWLEEAADHKPAGVAALGSKLPSSPSMKALAITQGKQTAIINMSRTTDDDRKALKEWLQDPGRPIVIHDGKGFLHMLSSEGFTATNIEHDTRLASYLIRPDLASFDLQSAVRRHLGRDLYYSDVMSWEEEHHSGRQMSLEVGDLSSDGEDDRSVTGVPWPEWAKLADNAEAPLELAAELARKLDDAGLYSIYENLEIPLVPILFGMEHAGIKVNRERMTALRDSTAEKLAKEVEEARALVDMPTLNLGSPKQLQEVLFDKLELPKTKKTKTGYSTAAKAIEQLAEKHPHPFLDHLLAHREYQKRVSTLDGLIKAIASDERVHTTFNQTATATGRLSSTDPNLQNIPVRTEEGRQIRAAFVPGEGYEALLTADYSQIEMRVMAHLSQDSGLIEAYRSGEDLHNFVGSQVFDVPVNEVTPELRRRVKALSYGLVYGLSEYGLSQQLDISVREAKKIMVKYFERFGGVRRYLNDVVDRARKDGYTSTMLGRRRYLPDLTSMNRQARENAERAALNAPIQGTAADIIKVAMIRVDAALKQEELGSRVLLQVHDELDVEVAKGELEQVRGIIQREMDEAIELAVPLEVGMAVGSDWNEAGH